MSKKMYVVTIPIAGHAVVEVEAENEDDAKEEALCKVRAEHLDSWEALTTFNTGNVCHCPSPWDIEAEEA
jgi:hypothetical protein